MTFSQPTLTPDDLATISVPVLVMAGDDDVATLAHTCSMYEAIPEGQLAIVPGDLAHALEGAHQGERAHHRALPALDVAARHVRPDAPGERRRSTTRKSRGKNCDTGYNCAQC